jgi:hypothetical protein
MLETYQGVAKDVKKNIKHRGLIYFMDRRLKSKCLLTMQNFKLSKRKEITRKIRNKILPTDI